MKKLFLLLIPAFLLSLSLGLGQIALAVCVPAAIPVKPPATDEVVASYKGCTAEKCGSKGYCGCKVTSTEGYSCVNVKKTTDLTTKYDCKTSMCPGATGTDQEEKCCKPKSGGTTTPGTDGGTVGGGGGKTVSFKPGDLSGVGDPSVPELIGLLVKSALGIVGSIALLMFVYGGFMMMISQGDATKITKGKTILVWSAIGIMIIFGSYIFVSFIITELGQAGSGGGAGTQVCGQGTLTDYSCMNKSLGTGCIKNLCPGNAENQCCKVKK